MAGVATVQPRSGHSSIVEMRLEVGAVSYRLCEVGSNFVVVDEEVALGPSEAELLVAVDGREHRQRIFLPNGLRRGENVIEAARAESE